MKTISGLTELTPPRDQAFAYLGQRLLRLGKSTRSRHLWADKSFRERPLLLLGEDDAATNSFLLQTAIRDSSQGHPVLFVDCTCDRTLLDTLHEWCYHRLKKNILCLAPASPLEDLSATWNPLICPALGKGAVAQSIMTCFSWMRSSSRARNLEFQNNAFNLLFRALEEGNVAFNMDDLQNLLESDGGLESLQEKKNFENSAPLSDLLEVKEKEAKYLRKLSELLTYLGLFSHWKLGSYQPALDLHAFVQSNNLLYVGLHRPLREPSSAALGNLLLNQILLLLDQIPDLPPMTLVTNLGESFLDEDAAEKILEKGTDKVRTVIGCRSLRDLKLASKSTAAHLAESQTTVALLSTSEAASVEWFSDLVARRSPETTPPLGDTPQLLRPGHCLLNTAGVVGCMAVELPALPLAGNIRFQAHAVPPAKTNTKPGLYAHRIQEQEEEEDKGEEKAGEE